VDDGDSNGDCVGGDGDGDGAVMTTMIQQSYVILSS